ncbi:MAG: UvrD-helicase domain-containing protein [Phycisphaeraceae bacterium]|nr:UvrD-helicase domain-containing protein [Phycisphaeraceae bacterium]MBX3367755.1 UvrD-helicase domain-containing protein [Phycisphaeraceae bacterium]
MSSPTPASDTVSPPLEHTLILASAGTGKTFQLTNRLIRLLAMGADPSTIVATTFTRKAAGEIMERIVERLCDAAEHADACRSLSQAIGIELSPDRCIDLLQRIASSLDRFSILTIDSFFQRIGTVLSIEAGMTLDSRVADDAEDTSLRVEALTRTISNADPSEIAAAIRLIYDGHPAAGVFMQLMSVIARGLHLLRETRHEPELWGLSVDPLYVLDDARLTEAIEQLRGAPLPTTKKAGEADARWKKAHMKSLDALVERDFTGFLGGLGGYVTTGSYYGKPFPPALASAYAPVHAHAVSRLRQRLTERTTASRHLLERFEHEYERLKEDRSVWRFEDVPLRVLRQIGIAGLDHVYYRLDGRVQHLLLDEFQDTSMLAFRLLEPLIDQIVSSSPPERSLFCVGDIKQSLYAWNGAEPELLPALGDKWPQLSQRPLHVSRRSSAVVLRAVNRVFGSLDKNTAITGNPDLAQRWSGQWIDHEAHDDSLPGEFTLLTPAAESADTATRDENDDSPQDDDKPTIASIEVSTVVERVIRHRDRCPLASIAVLVRSNKSIPPVIHALRTAGIPASEEGTASLLDAAPCAVFRSLFHLADHPTDTASKFHVSTSPLGRAIGIDAQSSERATATTAASLRAEVSQHGLTLTVHRLYLATHDAMSPRERSRVRSLVLLARRLDAEGRGACAELVDAIDSSRVRETSEATVRVMTTHAAKGLEFDVVILTDLNSAMFRQLPDLIGDREEALGPISRVIVRPSDSLREADSEIHSIATRCRNRTLMEGLCVLYVAMTRARYVLDAIVSGPSLKQPGKDSTTMYPGRLIVHACIGEQPLTELSGVLFSDAHGDWVSHIERREASSAATPRDRTVRQVTLSLKPARQRATGRLARVSPSSLEGGSTRTLSEFLRPTDERGRSRGTILHAIFEQIGWIEDGIPSLELLCDVASANGASPEQASEAAHAAVASIEHAEIRHWLSRSAFPIDPGETLELWRERAFATRLDSGSEPTLLSGRFDRVVVRRSSTSVPISATLLDFKTDAVTDDESLSKRAAHYAPQIRAYREAIMLATGLRPESVRCVLLFTELGRAVVPEGL